METIGKLYMLLINPKHSDSDVQDLSLKLTTCSQTKPDHKGTVDDINPALPIIRNRP